MVAKTIQQFCDGHAERYLLAFAYGYLGDHDLLARSTSCWPHSTSWSASAFVGAVTADR
ncbi:MULTISPECIES: hypothetical protein [unclassified Roseateles]|uniref:hypothetical protein n=1 Tax=unclassified Roseateles TaxID=2626991 RepID=UPI000A73AAF3|nr:MULTISPECIES: hypothetical protein [unclassified Roseateles]